MSSGKEEAFSNASKSSKLCLYQLLTILALGIISKFGGNKSISFKKKTLMIVLFLKSCYTCIIFARRTNNSLRKKI